MSVAHEAHRSLILTTAFWELDSSFIINCSYINQSFVLPADELIKEPHWDATKPNARPHTSLCHICLLTDQCRAVYKWRSLSAAHSILESDNEAKAESVLPNISNNAKPCWSLTEK